MKLYYSLNDERKGPVSADEFQALLANETITTETLVWKEGMENWLPYGEVENTFTENLSATSNDEIQRIKEGVELADGALPYASILRRFGALIIDGVLMYAINILAVALLTPILLASDSNAANGLFSLIIILVAYIPPILYHWLMVGKYGATLGKMLLKIKIVRSNGEKVSYLRALGRYFSTLLSGMILLVGYIMALFDSPQFRALHDRICDTRVIRK